MPGSDRVVPHSPYTWDEARHHLAGLMSRLAGTASAPWLDDLVQEACVRLLRAARRGDVREPEGMLVTVARRTWIDHLRRRSRWRARFAPLPEHADPPADPHEPLHADLGDILDRLELIVQEIFVGEGATECGRLLRPYLAAKDWRQVAAELELGYAAVRKRWSRCLTLVRGALARDPDFADFVTPSPGGAP